MPLNPYLVAAASLAFSVGLAHSVVGEILIFARLRRGEIVPTEGGSALTERHVRIPWASWHVLTVFGWALAFVLWLLAAEPGHGPLRAVLLPTIAVAMAAGAFLVFYGTRARHPGWLGLLGTAVLTWWGMGR